jgi:hypothetical protein
LCGQGSTMPHLGETSAGTVVDRQQSSTSL